MRAPPAALLAAALLAGCVTETREGGTDAAAAAARGGWNVSSGPAGPGGAAADEPHGPLFDPPPAAPGEAVEVPVEAYRPLDEFFDNEGYLVGDRLEIDCSAEPFLARAVALAFADNRSRYVDRQEGRDGDVQWIRLKNLVEGPSYMAEFLPKATFGSQRPVAPVLDRDGKPVGIRPRPVFEFLGTEEIVIRFHLRADPARPAWFRARAIGTPDPLKPDVARPAVYVNANRGRRVRGVDLHLDLSLGRGGDGAWACRIADPVGPAREGTERR